MTHCVMFSSICPKFLLFQASKSLPAYPCALEFGEHKHIDAIGGSSTLIISPCSLHLCGLKVLIFLV